jgi:hypothetical protein
MDEINPRCQSTRDYIPLLSAVPFDKLGAGSVGLSSAAGVSYAKTRALVSAGLVGHG